MRSVRKRRSVGIQEVLICFRQPALIIARSAQAGIAAIAQPGGSIRDDEVIAAANERGVSMVFTETRHFKH